MSRKKGTMLNEARKFFHGCTEREAHDLFWNATAFPFCGIDHIRKQLKEAAREGGGTPDGAIAWAHEQVETAMKSIT